MSRPPVANGMSAQRPVLIGRVNGNVRKVVATGLVLGMRKGDERWVTGDGVDPEITAGTLFEIHSDIESRAGIEHVATAGLDQVVEGPSLVALLTDIVDRLTRIEAQVTYPDAPAGGFTPTLVTNPDPDVVNDTPDVGPGVPSTSPDAVPYAPETGPEPAEATVAPPAAKRAKADAAARARTGSTDPT